LTRRFLPVADTSDIQPHAIFADFSNAFGVVDASPIFIQRSKSNQKDHYSGKYKAHYVKIQALVTADGECAHLSSVYYGSSHDKTIFDDSQDVRFLTMTTDDGPERKVILAGLGRVGVRRTIPEAILPHKRSPHRDLTTEQVEFNRNLSRNRILIEHFFGR
jgi:hypothetical protein